MTTVIRTTQVLVRAPLQKVFDYISDLTKHPEWSGGELRIEPTAPSPIAVGKEYVSHGEVATQKNRPNQLQVTEYQSPHKFSFVAIDPDFGKVFHVFTFTEQSGGVMVARQVTLNLNPFVAFAFRLIVYPLIGNPAMQKAFAKLKAKLES